MTAVLACQSGGGPIAGTWTAQFEGRTFLRLELKTVNGTITGGMSVGNIEVDGQGALRRVGELPRDLRPILDVTPHGLRRLSREALFRCHRSASATNFASCLSTIASIRSRWGFGKSGRNLGIPRSPFWPSQISSTLHGSSTAAAHFMARCKACSPSMPKT
jgi:hypothetical protein